MSVWTATLLFGLIVGAIGIYCAIKANQPNHKH